VQLESALGRFESLIGEERDAVRRVDADAIVRLAEEKESLMGVITGAIGEHPELHERFQGVVQGLRENSVLLVHARNCVRDVLQAVAAPSGTYGAGGSTRAAPLSKGVSVVG